MSTTVYRWNKETEKFEKVYDSEARFNEAPAVHFDEIPPMEHPATGRTFTSKKAFNAETLAAGCVPVAGCDKPSKRWESNAAKEEREHRQFSDAFERAFYDVRDRRIPEFRMNPDAARAWRRANGFRDD